MITKRFVTAALLDLCLQIRSLCQGRQDTQHAFGARLCEASVWTTVEEDHHGLEMQRGGTQWRRQVILAFYRCGSSLRPWKAPQDDQGTKSTGLGPESPFLTISINSSLQQPNTIAASSINMTISKLHWKTFGRRVLAKSSSRKQPFYNPLKTLKPMASRTNVWPPVD